MVIHDDTYTWEGFGGKLRLGNGRCRLRIFDLKQNADKGLAHLRPIIVVISDLPEGSVSIRSCTSHIATNVIREFNLNPQRILFIEYYPQSTYGPGKNLKIPERIEAVEFNWIDGNALKPQWRPLSPKLKDLVKSLIEKS
jgi:hypothetical protein